MLPGLRLVLAAIAATLVIVVLGFALLVKLQIAQSGSASIAPVEARFAGLAFAARADWTPVSSARPTALESLAPFARGRLTHPPTAESRPGDRPLPSALPYSERDLPLEAPAVQPGSLVAPSSTEASGDIAAASQAAAVGLPTDATPAVNVSAATERVAGAFHDAADVTATETVMALAPPVAPTRTRPSPTMTVSRLGQEPFTPATAAAVSMPSIPARATAPATEAAKVISTPIDPIPDAMTFGAAEVVAIREPALSPNAVVLPIPRPATADLRGAVPLPAPRPAVASSRQRKAQARPFRKKTARTPARRRVQPRRPAPPRAGAAPVNPFAALFGIRAGGAAQ